MFRFLKHCCILPGLIIALASTPSAEAAKASSIAGFIQANRRDSSIVVNAPKYDRSAKVFFLFYLGYNTQQQDKLEAVTEPLIPVSKEISGSGSELVMYLDFPPEQKNASAGNKKDKARRKTGSEKRSLAIKCPVINVFHSEAREALFKKDARGKEHSYGTYDLRAVNAKGTPLAYFSYNNGEIIMRDAESGEKKTIGNGNYSGNEWAGPAILASYQELVTKVCPENAAPLSPAESADHEASLPKKKTKKKSGKKRRNKD